MRKLIIILFWIVNISLNATIYYVKPTGNDSNSGLSDALAWKTWGKAFNSTSVQPGDTVYFRGGVYYKSLIAERTANPTWFYPIGETTTSGYNVTRDGTEDNYVNYWAYPGEVPILDCDTIVSPSASSHYAIRMVGVNWVYFKGLVIRNVWLTTNPAYAWNIGATNCKIENCKVYNVDGNGFRAEGCTNLTFKNCDAYNCYNSGGSYPGSQGTGFRTLGTDVTDSIFFIGCRSYHNSDQGFSLGDEYIRFDSCWSFNNTGQDHGDGHGFKLGWLDYDSDNTRRLVTNCIAAYNAAAGFTTNDNGYSIAGLTYVYNNTAYLNGGGFYVFNTTDTDVDENKRIFRNNIAYLNTVNTFIASGATYTHSYNSWDTPGVTITATDFVSVDSTGITAARQADGSLPDNDCYNYFLHLSNNSAAIDRGVVVGLPYEGNLPDLGAFEYNGYPVEPSAPQLSTTVPYNITLTSVTTGGAYIYDGGSTITSKGVCWDTSENPTISDNIQVCGSGTANFTTIVTDLLPNTVYHFRAYATNSVGTGYGANQQITTSEFGYIFNGTNYIFNGTTFIIK